MLAAELLGQNISQCHHGACHCPCSACQDTWARYQLSRAACISSRSSSISSSNMQPIGTYSWRKPAMTAMASSPSIAAMFRTDGELLEANSGDVSFPTAHAVVVHSTSEVQEPCSALPSAHLTAFKRVAQDSQCSAHMCSCELS